MGVSLTLCQIASSSRLAAGGRPEPCATPGNPELAAHPLRRSLTQGSKQISPCQPRARSQATTNGQEIPEFITDSETASRTGVVGESRPGRRDPGGAQAGAGTNRQPVRGETLIEITIAVESPAERAERQQEHNKRTRGRPEQLRWAAEEQQEGDENKGQRK